MAKKAKKASKQAGFTLIELLAVITIMGILMMVAIPAVSRTIENSRRDTFANTADQYITGIKNAVSADELECNVTGTADMETKIAAVPADTYKFYISTAAASINATAGADNAINIQQQTIDLIESGGKSSWSNADVKGVITIEKTTANNRTTYEYKIELVDSGNHGTIRAASSPVERGDISATSSQTYSGTGSIDSSFTASSNSNLVCRLS